MDKPFKPFTGTVDEYITALNKHNFQCEVCAPGGLPNPQYPGGCEKGNKIRHGLSAARGREAGQTGALL